jgi:hypothetical protein
MESLDEIVKGNVRYANVQATQNVGRYATVVSERMACNNPLGQDFLKIDRLSEQIFLIDIVDQGASDLGRILQHHLGLSRSLAESSGLRLGLAQAPGE